MKPFFIKSKFYIGFTLLLLAPSTWLASVIEASVVKLPHNSYLYQLSSLGIFEVPTAFIILLIAFWFTDNCLWKISIINKLIKHPNINGRYEGSLTSNFTKDNKQNGTYQVVLEIRQTLTSVSVCLYTERSCSYSLIANLCKNNTGNHELVYVYQNRTSALGSDADMKDHNGTAFLEIFNEGEELKGSYFNNPRDRERYGQFNVKRTGRKLTGRFD